MPKPVHAMPTVGRGHGGGGSPPPPTPSKPKSQPDELLPMLPAKNVGIRNAADAYRLYKAGLIDLGTAIMWCPWLANALTHE